MKTIGLVVALFAVAYAAGGSSERASEGTASYAGQGEGEAKAGGKGDFKLDVDFKAQGAQDLIGNFLGRGHGNAELGGQRKGELSGQSHGQANAQHAGHGHGHEHGHDGSAGFTGKSGNEHQNPPKDTNKNEESVESHEKH